MPKYTAREVSERELEDLIRLNAELIEQGLRYIDHQRSTERGPLDVLMVDSGSSLVVAELKVVEDDGMLGQALDYYDFAVRNLEGLARAYKDFNVDPRQPVRLFLVAPSFSVALLNRCKWIDVPTSLFSYKCIQLEGSSEVLPVFSEATIPSAPVVLEEYRLVDRLNYVTDASARRVMGDVLDEIRKWDSQKIAIEPVKYDISLKVSGRVFAYFGPRRKHFVVYTYDQDKKWTGFPIHEAADLDSVRKLLKDNVDRLG